jgi:FtsH-binding integral membrane protein
MDYPMPMDISVDDTYFKQNNDRIGFIRKVLGIVAFQLLLTALVTGLVISNEGLTEFVQAHPEINIITAVSSLIIAIVLLCCRDVSRAVPQNYILLTIFVIFI